MSFKEWILSSYPNPSIKGQWGLLHILTLVFCIGVIITLAFIFKNKSDKAKKILLYVLTGILILFELSRRIINLTKMTEFNWHDFLYVIMFRPWCAISSFCVILSTFTKSKNLKNLASMNALICALVFFAYPSVGFNNQYILFENLYSIATHSLLFIISITMIVLNFTHFDYKTMWKEVIGFVAIFAYAFIEIYLLKIESDPLYFMPNNEVQRVLGLNYTAFLFVYIIFLIIYVSLFYLITYLVKRYRKPKIK